MGHLFLEIPAVSSTTASTEAQKHRGLWSGFQRHLAMNPPAPPNAGLAMG